MKVACTIFLLNFSLLGSWSTVNAQEPTFRPLESFTALTITGDIEVSLKRDDKAGVSVLAYGVAFDKVLADVKDGELKLRMKKGFYKDVKVMVTVHYQDLAAIRTSAGAQLVADDALQTANLRLEANTNSVVNLQVAATVLNLEMSQDSKVTLSGQAEKGELSVVMGAILEGFELALNQANVKVATGGIARIHVLEGLDATAATTGSLQYKGAPAKERLDTKLGGSIEKVE